MSDLFYVTPLLKRTPRAGRTSGISTTAEEHAQLTTPTAPAAGRPTPKRGIPLSTIQAEASALGVELNVLRAVGFVESRGEGFLADGRPKILFEAHVFGAETGYRYNRSHPNLSSYDWNTNLYGPGGGYQHVRLEQAMRLNRRAALRSASWGRYQIMGFNAGDVGYPTVESFVAAMRESEIRHFEAFSRFLRGKPGMIHALRTRNWDQIAYLYNGPGYAEPDHMYHHKMRDAYWRFSNGR